MTLDMPDSTDAAALPPGYCQYLGYVDGQWPTAPELRRKFPAARVIGLTVTGSTLDADGIDCEPGNVNAADTRVWVQKKLAAAPGSRPVVYASVTGQPNFGMHDIIDALVRNRIDLARVRLLSAHYGAGEHICGPKSCGLIAIPMDGTQWTDSFPVAAGAAVDMSVLADGFFTLTWTEELVRQLGTVHQGMTGEPVRTVQGALAARHHVVAIDGVFGPQTDRAVRAVQQQARITADGVVGEQTWPVLLGIA